MSESALMWINNRILLRRFSIKGRLVTKSPLRVGSGRGKQYLGSTVDLAVIKYESTGTPYIPGNSLKGVFRSTGERIANTRGIKVCSGLSKQTCPDTKKVEGIPLLKWLDNKRREIRSKPEKYQEGYREILRVVFDNTCINCKLFGAPSISGKLFFYDSEPEKYTLGVRTGIAISRSTGAVARGALFQVEYVEPGSIFYFRLDGMNLPNYAIGYIAEIIGELNSGRVRVGGLKSRGFGLVEIILEELKIDTYDGSMELRPLDNFDKLVNVAPGVYHKEQIPEILKKFIEAWRGVRIEYPLEASGY